MASVQTYPTLQPEVANFEVVKPSQKQRWITGGIFALLLIIAAIVTAVVVTRKHENSTSEFLVEDTNGFDYAKQDLDSTTVVPAPVDPAPVDPAPGAPASNEADPGEA